MEQVLIEEEARWGARSPLKMALAGPGVHETARNLDSKGRGTG